MTIETTTIICSDCGQLFAARTFRSQSAVMGEIIRQDTRCTPCNNADWLTEAFGPGWMPLLAEADTRMRAIDAGYRIVDLKQKFGTLRLVPFTSPAADDAQWDALHAVANEILERSRTICQDCGAPAPLFDLTRSNRTLCPRHIEKRGAPDGRFG